MIVYAVLSSRTMQGGIYIYLNIYPTSHAPRSRLTPTP